MTVGSDGEGYQARLDAFAGVETGPAVDGPDEVNAAMIRHWCDAIGDDNPVYTDEHAAAASVHGGIVAPPTMLQGWVMHRLDHGRTAAPAGHGPYERLTATLAERGFTSVVATNCEQTYPRYLRPGDRVSMRTAIEGVSAEKQTTLGAGHFITTRQDYVDADGELVGSMRLRILRFRPPPCTSERDASPSTPRPAPALTPDNRWWFEALDAGKLLVRRCTSCGRVHHPPGPMCPSCNAMEWTTVVAGPCGVVHSFVRVHHPQVPAFEYPLDVLLVDVDVAAVGETVRMLMNRADAGPTAIGERVRVEIRDLDGTRKLPVVVATAGPAESAG